VVIDAAGQAGPFGLNATGQVAYSSGAGSAIRARLHDGNASRAISPDPARAVAVNATGRVAGHLLTDGGTRAFVWDPSTLALTLVDTAPGIATAVEQINAAGQVVGTATRQGFPDAFRWTPGAGLEILRPLPAANGAIPMAAALFINAGGTAVGISAVDPTPHLHAALWVAGTEVRDLGTLGGPESSPAGINDAGQVAGKSRTTAGTMHAFLWSAATGMQDLGTLGGPNSAATALNATGAVAGISDSDAGPRAFRWQDGRMVSLGGLGGASSAATAINAAGHVGGTAQLADGSPRAFVWSPEDGMVDLNTRLAGSGVPTLGAVIALADDGTVLASSSGGLMVLRPHSP
jgi:probable HAF family extracellular repeat protein